MLRDSLRADHVPSIRRVPVLSGRVVREDRAAQARVLVLVHVPVSVHVLAVLEPVRLALRLRAKLHVLLVLPVHRRAAGGSSNIRRLKKAR